MARRTYNQYCATARTLDVVGERWALLLIRELLTGPKRFGDLLESLHEARGVVKIPAHGLERPANAERLPFDECYIRTTPRFETADERYAWLSALVVVAHNSLSPDHVDYRMYRVLRPGPPRPARGLGSYVMTTDREQAERLANRLEAGMVFINGVGAEGAELPFGDVKRSGFGRELGRYGADEFVSTARVASIPPSSTCMRVSRPNRVGQ